MANIGDIFMCESCGNGVMVIKEGTNSEVGCCRFPMYRKKLSLT